VVAKTLMIQGAASSVGKSLLVAGLCRLYARRGVRVAPFKAQNMSNNAGVTPEGGEIGRAQVTQAEACGISPHVDMNPVLLKPEADSRSQVVVLGKKLDTLPARDYYRRKAELWEVVTAALARLRARNDLVLIEGAGSPAELNLRRGDIVNMAVALHAHAPVLLAGDIDKGGIFAQLLGTLWLLEPEERALVAGLIVNKFRGDPGLFTDGVRILEERGGVPVLGVVPWLRDHGIPEEDGAGLDDLASGPPAPPILGGGHNATAGPSDPPILGGGDGPTVDIAVIKLPRIANFDDFDPLAAEPGVRVRFVQAPEALGRPDAIILPGTKHTLADLAWLTITGLAHAVLSHARRGGAVVGICGGYQMLGRAIRDPDGVEGGGEAAGLGLLPVEVTFVGEKVTQQAIARPVDHWPWLGTVESLTGYEIHAGRAETPVPLLELTRQDGSRALDGACTPDGRAWGTHLHGLFHNDGFRQAWLASLGWRSQGGELSYLARKAASYNRLADALETALDVRRLDAIIGL
jgi:adenosylcobyric acid synthase